MAELTLKTRLLNKMSEGHVADLRKGEINFYPAGNYLVMEVGGANEKPFAALASDVYDWAKAKNKPSYVAEEIDGLAGYIAGKVQDTNTTYTFTVKEATGELEITSHELNGESKTLGTFDVVSHDELNTKLAAYVTQTALVEALSVLDNYAKKDDLAPYATITYVDGEIDKVETAIAGVKATADAAAVKTEVETALAGKVDVVTGKSLVADTEIARLATLVNYDDTAIKADIEANADAIDAIKADYLKAADKTDLTNAINAEKSRAEAAEQKAFDDAKAYADGLADNYDEAGAAAAAETAAKAYADGLASNYDEAGAAAAAEANAKAHADEIKADLLGDDLTTTFDTLKAVQDWVDEHGEAAANLTEGLANETKAREEADTALDGKITAEATARENADKALGERIDTVSAVADAAQTANEVADAIDAKIVALKAEDLWDAKGTADAAITALKAEDLWDAKGTADTAIEALKAEDLWEAKGAAATAEANAKKYADDNDKDTTYEAGAGLKLDGTVFSIDTDLVFILDANA